MDFVYINIPSSYTQLSEKIKWITEYKKTVESKHFLIDFLLKKNLVSTSMFKKMQFAWIIGLCFDSSKLDRQCQIPLTSSFSASSDFLWKSSDKQMEMLEAKNVIVTLNTVFL